VSIAPTLHLVLAVQVSEWQARRAITMHLSFWILHTNAGCSISNYDTPYSGTLMTSNCDVYALGQVTNAGCLIKSPSFQTFGNGFNAIGGGVYATEWTSTAISIYFFPRNAIPADITSGNPDPSGWGEPQAIFSGDCDIDSHLVDQRIVSCPLTISNMLTSC